MKAYRGGEVWLHLFLNLPIYMGEWSAYHPGCFAPKERAPPLPLHPVKMRLDRPQSQSRYFRVQPAADSFIDCTILGPVKHYCTANKHNSVYARFHHSLHQIYSSVSVVRSSQPRATFLSVHWYYTLFMQVTLATHLKSCKYAKLQYEILK
jgi:hypothetical protein